MHEPPPKFGTYVIGVALWTFSEILIDTTSYSESTSHDFATLGIDDNFFRELYRYLRSEFANFK